MIKFTFGFETYKKRFKELVLFQVRNIIKIGMIPVAFALYLIINGIFSDSETLNMGISVSCFVLIMLASLILGVIFKTRKDMNDYYNRQKDKGIIELQISKNGDDYKWESLQRGTVVVFSKNEIIKKHIGKNFIIIQLKSKVIFDFPKRDDILNLFN